MPQESLIDSNITVIDSLSSFPYINTTAVIAGIIIVTIVLAVVISLTGKRRRK